MHIYENFSYVSKRKSKVLNPNSAYKYGIVVNLRFKKRRFFNIFKSDYKDIVFILPLKAFFPEDAPYGTVGGAKEGVFCRRWWELRDKEEINLYWVMTTRTPIAQRFAKLSIKRVRNKKLIKILNELKFDIHMLPLL